MKKIFLTLVSALTLASCTTSTKFDVNANLDYCHKQALWTLEEIGDTTMMPRNILSNQVHWNLVPSIVQEWTVGFWPGSLWYVYEATGDEKILKSATHYTELLLPLSQQPAYDHDLGFQMFCSYGNAYRLTGRKEYKKVVLDCADILATLFNPAVGTILSWPREVDNGRFAPHNTIMDNMINLEMLYWAARNGGDKSLYDIATKHAETTMQNHFRPDGGCYHVALYDNVSGDLIKAVTHQGYADESLWARGQSWAIYGYTVVYRETKDPKFLRFAEKVTDLYLSRLPKDSYVPYWDFDAPNIPNEPKDASASAVVASALFELAELEDNSQKAKDYRDAAIKMVQELSTPAFQSGNSKPSFLLHSTGHWPNGSEIDAAINYADYYYVEALTRYKNWVNGRPVVDVY